MAPGPAVAQGGRELGPAPVWKEEGHHPPEQSRGERERGREGGRIKWEKMKLWRGLFGNICQCGNTWHASLALDTCVAHLEPQTKHLTEFRDPNARFKSLGIYVELWDKFGDLECNLLYKFHNSHSHATNDCNVSCHQIQSAMNEERLVFSEMKIDKTSFRIYTNVHIIDLNYAKVLIRQEQAEVAKGKNVIIGERKT